MLGVVGLSVLCHAILISMLAAVTGSIVGGDADFQREYHVRLIAQSTQDENQGGFRFPGKAHLDRPVVQEHQDGVEDLASLLRKDRTAPIEPMEADESDLQTLAVDRLRRTDVVGATMVEKGDLSVGFGERDLAGGGPVGSMWGVGKGQRARSIVYVMDRSASMIDAYETKELQRELFRSIGLLQSPQLFNIVWFGDGKAIAWSLQMQRATYENKRAAFNSTKKNIIAAGESNPIEAVRKGLAFRPDVMFLLSDGDFGENNKRVLELIRNKNRDHHTIINTILFVFHLGGEDNWIQRDYQHVLRTIAKTNHGSFKSVSVKTPGG